METTSKHHKAKRLRNRMTASHQVKTNPMLGMNKLHARAGMDEAKEILVQKTNKQTAAKWTLSIHCVSTQNFKAQVNPGTTSKTSSQGTQPFRASPSAPLPTPWAPGPIAPAEMQLTASRTRQSLASLRFGANGSGQQSHLRIPRQKLANPA